MLSPAAVTLNDRLPRPLTCSRSGLALAFMMPGALKISAALVRGQRRAMAESQAMRRKGGAESRRLVGRWTLSAVCVRPM